MSDNINISLKERIVEEVLDNNSIQMQGIREAFSSEYMDQRRKDIHSAQFFDMMNTTLKKMSNANMSKSALYTNMALRFYKKDIGRTKHRSDILPVQFHADMTSNSMPSQYSKMFAENKHDILSKDFGTSAVYEKIKNKNSVVMPLQINEGGSYFDDVQTLQSDIIGSVIVNDWMKDKQMISTKGVDIRSAHDSISINNLLYKPRLMYVDLSSHKEFGDCVGTFIDVDRNNIYDDTLRVPAVVVMKNGNRLSSVSTIVDFEDISKNSHFDIDFDKNIMAAGVKGSVITDMSNIDKEVDLNAVENALKFSFSSYQELNRLMAYNDAMKAVDSRYVRPEKSDQPKISNVVYTESKEIGTKSVKAYDLSEVTDTVRTNHVYTKSNMDREIASFHVDDHKGWRNIKNVDRTVTSKDQEAGKYEDKQVGSYVYDIVQKLDENDMVWRQIVDVPGYISSGQFAQEKDSSKYRALVDIKAYDVGTPGDQVVVTKFDTLQNIKSKSDESMDSDSGIEGLGE